jgi:hypothetical protein
VNRIDRDHYPASSEEEWIDLERLREIITEIESLSGRAITPVDLLNRLGIGDGELDLLKPRTGLVDYRDASGGIVRREAASGASSAAVPPHCCHGSFSLQAGQMTPNSRVGSGWSVIAAHCSHAHVGRLRRVSSCSGFGERSTPFGQAIVPASGSPQTVAK